MQTVSFDLPDPLASMFSHICLKNKVAQNAIFQELVSRYLEDVEDGIAANLALEESSDSQNWKTLDELAQELQLDSKIQ